MLIGELAERAGLTRDTIRFYEKEGLLDDNHFERTDNNYKHYKPEALERLRFIARAKCAGFTLSELTQFTVGGDNLAPEELKQKLVDKMRQIDQRMAQLAKMRAYLSDLLTDRFPECGLLPR